MFTYILLVLVTLVVGPRYATQQSLKAKIKTVHDIDFPVYHDKDGFARSINYNWENIVLMKSNEYTITYANLSQDCDPTERKKTRTGMIYSRYPEAAAEEVSSTLMKLCKCKAEGVHIWLGNKRIFNKHIIINKTDECLCKTISPVHADTYNMEKASYFERKCWISFNPIYLPAKRVLERFTNLKKQTNQRNTRSWGGFWSFIEGFLKLLGVIVPEIIKIFNSNKRAADEYNYLLSQAIIPTKLECIYKDLPDDQDNSDYVPEQDLNNLAIEHEGDTEPDRFLKVTSQRSEDMSIDVFLNDKMAGEGTIITEGKVYRALEKEDEIQGLGILECGCLGELCRTRHEDYCLGDGSNKEIIKIPKNLPNADKKCLWKKSCWEERGGDILKMIKTNFDSNVVSELTQLAKVGIPTVGIILLIIIIHVGLCLFCSCKAWLRRRRLQEIEDF